ncbi:MAG TPA: vWA domain-containing protein [Thermodesulfobacteriota bacterium]|nr:vWA domain-containing protein [Thermodesulfobacteriota bacterium]
MSRPIILILIVLLAGIMHPGGVWSDSASKETSAHPGSHQERVPAPKPLPNPTEGSDIIFILDCSGSMKKTDPQDFRKPATELMVSLLGAKDRIGLIRFGDKAETLIPLTENKKENASLFSRAIQEITSKDLTTDLYSAVLRGYEGIKDSPRKNRILVLMSDGKMDLGSQKQDEEALKKLEDLLPEIIRYKIKLYTVAFTDLSDQKLLAHLAEKTGGIFNMAKTDKDLHIIFSSIFEQIKSPDTVPLEGDSFFIDQDIQEATVLITKGTEVTAKFVDPQGKEFHYGRTNENINWYQTKAFDLITLKKPTPGRWKVQLSSKEGNKIFILTDLTLKSSLTMNQVHQGQDQEILVWLERNDQKISEKKILESLFVIADIKEPGGTHARINLFSRETDGKSVNAGVFANRYSFKNVGLYTIQITVDGKTFKRELVHQITALTPQQVSNPSNKGHQGAPAPDHSRGAWTRAFIKLGLVNMAGLLIGGLIYGGLWWTRKRVPNKGKS